MVSSNSWDIICFSFSLDFSGIICIINSNLSSFSTFIWCLWKRIYWPDKSPSSRISWWLSVVSYLINSWSNNSILFSSGGSSCICLRFTNCCFIGCFISSLFCNYSWCTSYRRIKNTSIWIWSGPWIRSNLCPILMLILKDPLIMVNIVFNFLYIVFCSCGGIFIESLSVLICHSSSMSWGSISFTWMLGCNNISSFLSVFLKSSSVWIWSNCRRISLR